MNQTLKQFKQIKEDYYQTKVKLEQTKEELKKAIDEIKQIKSDKNKYTQSIIVSGLDRYN